MKTEYKTTEERIFAGFRRFNKILKREEFGHHGKSRILNELVLGGKMSQKELQEKVEITSSSASELLKKMEEHGLITRKASPEDSRGLIVEVTEEGKKMNDTLVSEKSEKAKALIDGISALLILMVSPKMALGFLIMFIVLQQIEGKLIYPHVVGSSVGLPGIWVLLAITVGGELMGVAGMLVFVPLCSVLYALFREFVYNRLAERQVTPDKWAVNPPKAAHGEPLEAKERLLKLKERKAHAADTPEKPEEPEE